MTKQGLKFLPQTEVTGVTKQRSSIKVNIEDVKKGKSEEVRLLTEFQLFGFKLYIMASDFLHATASAGRYC